MVGHRHFGGADSRGRARNFGQRGAAFYTTAVRFLSSSFRLCPSPRCRDARQRVGAGGRRRAWAAGQARRYVEGPQPSSGGSRRRSASPPANPLQSRTREPRAAKRAGHGARPWCSRTSRASGAPGSGAPQKMHGGSCASNRLYYIAVLTSRERGAGTFQAPLRRRPHRCPPRWGRGPKGDFHELAGLHRRSPCRCPCCSGQRAALGDRFGVRARAGTHQPPALAGARAARQRPAGKGAARQAFGRRTGALNAQAPRPLLRARKTVRVASVARRPRGCSAHAVRFEPAA